MLKQLASLSLSALIGIFDEHSVDLARAKTFSAALGKKVTEKFYSNCPMRVVNRMKMDLVIVDIHDFLKALKEKESSGETTKRLVSVVKNNASAGSSQSAFVAFDAMAERVEDLENAFCEHQFANETIAEIAIEMKAMAVSLKALLSKKCNHCNSDSEDISSPTRKKSVRPETSDAGMNVITPKIAKDVFSKLRKDVVPGSGCNNYSGPRNHNNNKISSNKHTVVLKNLVVNQANVPGSSITSVSNGNKAIATNSMGQKHVSSGMSYASSVIKNNNEFQLAGGRKRKTHNVVKSTCVDVAHKDLTFEKEVYFALLVFTQE